MQGDNPGGGCSRPAKLGLQWFEEYTKGVLNSESDSSDKKGSSYYCPAVEYSVLFLISRVKRLPYIVAVLDKALPSEAV